MLLNDDYLRGFADAAGIRGLPKPKPSPRGAFDAAMTELGKPTKLTPEAHKKIMAFLMTKMSTEEANEFAEKFLDPLLEGAEDDMPSRGANNIPLNNIEALARGSDAKLRVLAKDHLIKVRDRNRSDFARRFPEAARIGHDVFGRRD